MATAGFAVISLGGNIAFMALAIAARTGTAELVFSLVGWVWLIAFMFVGLFSIERAAAAFAFDKSTAFPVVFALMRPRRGLPPGGPLEGRFRRASACWPSLNTELALAAGHLRAPEKFHNRRMQAISWGLAILFVGLAYMIKTQGTQYAVFYPTLAMVALNIVVVLTLARHVRDYQWLANLI